MKWRALPINTRCAPCIYVYIRVKRSYFRKKRLWNAAKRKIRGGNALLIAQNSRITKRKSARKQAIYNYNYNYNNNYYIYTTTTVNYNIYIIINNIYNIQYIYYIIYYILYIYKIYIIYYIIAYSIYARARMPPFNPSFCKLRDYKIVLNIFTCKKN